MKNEICPKFQRCDECNVREKERDGKESRKKRKKKGHEINKKYNVNRCAKKIDKVTGWPLVWMKMNSESSICPMSGRGKREKRKGICIV